MSYLEKHTGPTPQSEAIPVTDQIENSAGGFAWQVDVWTRLRRFLILGSEGGSYYASEHDLTRENVDAVREALKQDGKRAVDEIVSVSTQGRAPKNDPALYALAMACSVLDRETREYALRALPMVARIGTHLYMFMAFAKTMRGTGKGLQRAILRWYEFKEPDKLAVQLVKYRQRHGWMHRDMLRVAHRHIGGKPDDAHAQLYEWAVRKDESELLSETLELPALVTAYERARTADTQQLVELIREHNLPREAVPTEALKSPEVWEALLQRMPMTALIRNLGNMTKNGLLTPTSQATKHATGLLGDQDAIKQSRVHPVQVLAALATYRSGRGARGRGEWNPVPVIVDALDAAYYMAFDNVEPTGARTLLAIDISPSMAGSEIASVPGLTARMGAAAMAMVTARLETTYEAVAFAGARHGGWSGRQSINRLQAVRDGLVSFPLSGRQRLDDVIREAENISQNYSRTDCALPMLYALEQEREFDTFVVYTDSETWYGQHGHPAEALKEYRRKSGIPARLIVVGMVSNDISIADPADAGMLDVVGFDTAAPQMISDFAAGRV